MAFPVPEGRAPEALAGVLTCFAALVYGMLRHALFEQIDRVLRSALVQLQADPRFESAADHVFAVRVVVPSKRSLFNANGPVSVGSVEIRTTVNGRTRTRNERIDQVMNPDTSRSFDLETIADHVEVAVESTSKSEAVIETHYRQAVPQDDPANPAYSTIQSLQRLRGSADPRAIDSEIADVERSLIPGADPLPLLTIIADLRRADDLMRSKKEDEQQKGDKLLKETLRRLR